MADDIRIDEFENRGDASQGDRLRTDDAGSGGGSNANADLREKGDADDIAEAVIQGDAEGATRDVGLRSDSPVDLTREEVDRNPQQHADNTDDTTIADPLQQSSVEQTAENQPIADNSSAPDLDITERTSTRSASATVQTDELPPEAVSRATTENGNAGPVAPGTIDPVIQTGAPAADEIEPEIVPKETSAADIAEEQFVPNGVVFEGGKGDDTFSGTNRADYISGGAGNDELHGLGGTDFISGGDGDDALFGEGGKDTLVGGHGNDFLDGGNGKDTLDGGEGDDVLIGGGGQDTLDGGKGDDTLIGDNGKDILHGGEGNDTLIGGNGKDTLDGGKGNDILDGGAGNDILIGGEGNDILDGGAGNDTLIGGEGDDILFGGEGKDTFVLDQNFGNDVIIDFEPGHDTIDLSALGIDNFDALMLNAHTDGGNTVIKTEHGSLTLNNVSLSDLSADSFVFDQKPVADEPVDTATDTASETPPINEPPVVDPPVDTTGDTTGDTGVDASDSGTGTDGDTGTDTGSDPISDTVDPAPDPVVDGVEIDGGNGKDVLEGGAGDDTLNGGNGKDVLNGGAGDDVLTGGNGNDVFEFDQGFGNDTITDFTPGNDQIDLSSLGIPDMSTLMGMASMDGNDTLITTDEGTITLSGVDMNDLSTGDFMFGDAPATNPTSTDPAADTATDTAADDTGTGTTGDTGGVATQPDTTSADGDMPAGDAGTETIGETGGDTGGVATQPDTTATGSDAPAGDTGTGTTGETGGDTGGVATQPDATGTGGSAGTPDDGTGATATTETTGTAADTGTMAGTGGTGQTPPVTDIPVAQPPAPTIQGDGGSNSISGSDGNDVVDAGSGNDRVSTGNGDDIVDAGTGNDRVYGGSGDDTVSGGEGNDRVSGGSGNDALSGGEGSDRLSGGSGNDTLDGGAGDDTMYGGNGEDSLTGGSGNDYLNSGKGDDTLDGGEGDDRLSGGNGSDVLDGGTGADRLYGGRDDDSLAGGDGNDRLYGGSGDDIIDGGADDDYLKGDSGADTFSFGGEFGDDTVRDFDVREGDSIDLSNTEIGDFRSLMDNSRQDGNNTVIDLEGGSITLRDVDRNDLTSDRFAFAENSGPTISEPGTVHEIPDLPAFDSINAKTDGANGVNPDAVTVSSAQTVTMTFEGESAGYQSSVGHYTVDADGVIQNIEMDWTNASQQGSGGDLVPGEAQVSFDVDAGARVGVFMVPNGNKQNDFSEMTDGHFEFRDDAGEPATINTASPTLVFVHNDGNESVINSQSGEIFHSAGPDMHGDNLEHSVSGVNDDGDLMIGFEDLVGGGDQDYEDLVVKLDFEPIMDDATPEQDSAFSDGSGGTGPADMVSTDFDFVDDVSGGAETMDEAVFNLDFTDLIPEGADEGQFEVRVSGLPNQVSSSKGEVDSDRNWTLTMMQVVGLAIAVPAAASAADLMEDITFQVVDTENGQVVAEGLLDGDALDAGEHTVSVLPQLMEEERGNNGNAKGHDKQEETAAAEEAEAGQGSPAPLEEGGAAATNVNHAAAPAAAEEVVPEPEAETDEVIDETVEATAPPASSDTVVATDDGPAAPANSAPTDFNLFTFVVGENTWANNSPVGQVNPVDPDAGDTFSYSLTDNAGGRFLIDANGMVRVSDASLLDYETATNHDVTIRVTDSAGNTYDESHTIHLYNENDTPTDMSISASTVAENAANSTVVGTVSTTDQDAGETFTYALTNDQGGRFAIDTNTGVVTVADGSKLDYETRASHDITVRVTDSNGATYDETMTINLTNVNETPTDLKLTNVEIAEGAANGTVVGTAAATDADAGESFTYSLTDNAGGRFTVDGTTGEITVANGTLLDHESATSHDITVRVTDGGGNTYDETYTIGVNDQVEHADSYVAEVISHEPVGYWRMDEVEAAGGSHTMASEIGGPNATTYNTDLGTENGAFGNISTNTTDFWGDDYVVVPDDPAWQLTDGTVQLTFKNEDWTGNFTILSRDSTGTNEGDIRVYTTADDLSVTLRGTNGGTLTVPNVISNNTWYQLDVTFGADGLEIWLNGTRVGNDPSITGGIDGNNEPWVIGANSSNSTSGGALDSLNGFFNGDIGEFAIFDSQLDSTAINDMYDAGVNGEDLQTLTAGNDTDSGSTGVDMINGAAGDDYLAGNNGDDFLYGGDGDDTIDGGSHDDVISGGAGTDTVDYSGFGSGVTVNLATGTATDGGGGTDTLSGIENVLGTGAADNITGDDADNVLTGNAGNDILSGGGGDDTLYGGAGNDTLTGGAGDDLFQGGSGNDNMDGGAGTDTVTYDGAANGVTVNLATGTATDGVGDTDTLTSIENLIGSANNDTFTGNGSVNEFTGGDGSDRFIMGEGGTMDTVHGGAGGGWTDTLQLMNTDASAVGGGWTVQLTTGTVAGDDGSTMTLTDDAAGTITLEDGSQIAFDGLERIEY